MARTPIHPGEFLADELEELKLSASAVAKMLDVPVNRITQIINGKRAITADTALRLSRWLGTSAEMWMNLQKVYELDLARQDGDKEIRKSVRPLPDKYRPTHTSP